jgi:hypothetical protein
MNIDINWILQMHKVPKSGIGPVKKHLTEKRAKVDARHDFKSELTSSLNSVIIMHTTCVSQLMTLHPLIKSVKNDEHRRKLNCDVAGLTKDITDIQNGIKSIQSDIKEAGTLSSKRSLDCLAGAGILSDIAEYLNYVEIVKDSIQGMGDAVSELLTTDEGKKV